ncbi:MAG: MBL fold metallo-hydrolase [bacterium]|nr:MBL fold metallo-hydrolase [bacterium]
MLKMTRHGPVTRLLLGRNVAGRTLYLTAAYLVGDLLIDTGCPRTARQLEQALEDLPVRQVALTHHHEDHVGGLARIQAGAPIPAYAHPLALGRILDPPRRLAFYREVVWGVPAAARASPLPDELAAGPYRLRVLHTPGHCPDHVAFYEPREGWLFTGDLFLGERVKQLRPRENVEATMQSLRRLPGSDYTIFCGGGRVVEDGPAAVARKLAYWEGLGEQARALAAEGWKVDAITTRLLGREGFLWLATGGDSAKRHLIRSFLG